MGVQEFVMQELQQGYLRFSTQLHMESERSYCLMITNQPHQSSNDQFKVTFTRDDILIQLGSKLIQQRYHFTRCGLGNSFSHNHKMKLYMHQQCTDNLSLRKCKTIYSYIEGVYSRCCLTRNISNVVLPNMP